MRNQYSNPSINGLRGLLRMMAILGVLMVSLAFDVSAQGTIKGKVGDGTGEPLPGANVFIKGTTIGTITDFDGNFTLQGVPAGDHTIGVSFMGFETIEEFMKVVDGATVTKNYTLKEDSEQIDEVVVIGYGVQKKKLTTGANVQVSGDDIDRMKSTNALQALQGQTAGVNITSTSGQPGEGMKVAVRGVGSLNGSNPLYIVDGVQTGDISYLNNSDIESIDILKDAASAAIYGSQASNGVVLITTKSGKAGHSQVYFDGYFGIQQRPAKYDLCNTNQYVELVNESALNSGVNPTKLPFSNTDAYKVNGVLANTDWLDEMFVDNAKTQNYTIGALGGNDVSTYALSMGYMGQEGIVGGKDASNYERFNGRINTEHKLYNGILKVGEHLSYSHVKKNGIQIGNHYGNSLRSAFMVSPLLPMYDENGEYYSTTKGNWFASEANPYAVMMLTQQNLTKNTNVIGDMYFILEPIKNLRFRSSLGIDFYGTDYRSYVPQYELSSNSSKANSEVSQSMSKGTTMSIDNTLSYAWTLGKHKIEPMIGMWMSRYDGDYLYGKNNDLTFESFEYAYLSNAVASDIPTSNLQGSPSQTRMLSYFGRLQYNYNETYMMNATFRADGSSKFAPNNRWGYFPSISAGWVVSNEAFMQNQHVLDFLKIRGSWGQVGNQSISDFQYLATISFTDAYYPFGSGDNTYSDASGDSGSNQSGSMPKRLANPDLKWETSEQLDFGFDARFLKNTLSVNFDFYKKSTKDWLLIAPVVATAGAEAPYTNGGNVNNTGVELAITYQNHAGKFNYQVTVNGAYNKNEITDIPGTGFINGPSGQVWATSPAVSRCEPGHPVGYFYGYKTAGIFKTDAEAKAYTEAHHNTKIHSSNPVAGDVIFVDANNDGYLNDEDRVELGKSNPDFTFGFTLSCDYKAWDFMLSANGVAGNQIAQICRDNGNQYANYSLEQYENRFHNGKGSLPRVTATNQNYGVFSDLFIKDGDFLRISNVTLGYDLCKQIKVPGFSQMRFYVSAQNLYTFTKYSGMDPEIGYGISDENYSFSNGIDLGYYPRPRTILFGISLKL